MEESWCPKMLLLRIWSAQATYVIFVARALLPCVSERVFVFGWEKRTRVFSCHIVAHMEHEVVNGCLCWGIPQSGT